MRAAFIKLHLSIILGGLTGVLGKLIGLAEGPLVWYRMLLTAFLFYAYLKINHKVRQIPFKEKLRIGLVGAIISLSWVFFYGSIKYANVSVAVVCFSMIGFFTALFEPLIYRRALSLRDIFISLITVLGIMLIFHFDMRYRTGIILGVVATFLAALFTVFTKRVGQNHAPGTMLLYEMIGGFVLLSILMPLYLKLFPGVNLTPTLKDVFYLLILSSFCTIGMFILQFQALKRLSAFTVNLSFNLEPIYSIILAILFLGEAGELHLSFYAGLGCVCLSVIIQTLLAFKERKPV